MHLSARFDIPPTQWDRQTRLQDEKRVLDDDFPIYHIVKLQDYDEHFNVHLRELPAQRIAYIRVYEPFSDDTRIDDSYRQLIEWFRMRGGELRGHNLVWHVDG